MPGKVTLVGAGPGDPGLLTLKGKAALENADVVLYDRLADKRIVELVPERCERIYVGKRSGEHTVGQDDINRMLLEHALNGKNVVRLKGGDSFVFGRGGEELELLCKNNIDFEVIPGVTSAVAVPEYAGIPVTHRGASSSVHIATAHTKQGKNPDIDFKKYAGIGGTLVFLMGASLLGFIVNGLMDAGMDKYTPCAVIERGTTPMQKKTLGTLCDIEKKAGKPESPAVIVIGGVCELSEKFDWYSRLPLRGKTIAVTRHEEHSSGLSGMLRELGADVIECPCIHIESLIDRKTALRIKRELPKYDIVVFTSANGVKTVMEGLYSIGCDARAFGDSKIAVIGGATSQAFKKYGINADIMPEKYSGKALGRALAKAAKRGGRVLLLRAESSNKDLDSVLDQSGIDHSEIKVYKTVSECELNITELINRKKIDYVTFTSGSTVRGFMQFHEYAELSSFKAICIGDVTATEAKKYGMSCITAENSSIEAMTEAIINDIKGQTEVKNG